MKRVQSNALSSQKLATRRTHDAAFKRRLVELTLAPRASVRVEPKVREHG